LGVNVAGIGYVAVDLRPRTLSKDLFDHPPGYLVHPRKPSEGLTGGYQLVGKIAAVEWSEAEAKAFGAEIEEVSLTAVIYYGAITGWIGLAAGLTEAKPKAPLPSKRKVSKLIEQAMEKFAYEKDPKMGRLGEELAAEDELFNVGSCFPRTIGYDKDAVDDLSNIVVKSKRLTHWGRQWSPDRVERPITGAAKPVGAIAIGCGFRFWMIGGMGPYRSSSPRRVSKERPNIRKEFEKVLDNIDEWRVWKSVRWGGEWIEED